MATQQEIQKQLQALVRQVRADSDRENEQRNQALKAAEERGAARAEAARDQFLRVGPRERPRGRRRHRVGAAAGYRRTDTEALPVRAVQRPGPQPNQPPRGDDRVGAGRLPAV